MMAEVPVLLRSGFNYDRDAASVESGLECVGDGRTKQSFKEEVDINTIIRRFGISGHLPVGVRMPTYGDYTDVTDYHSALNAIALAAEAFDAMPAEVRTRFHNNPAEFVDFCSDVDNRAEAIKLGLVLPQAAVLASDAVAAAAPPPAAPTAAA